MSTFDELARAGITAIGERRFDDAVRDLTAAHALEPDRPDICNALGMAHLRRGEPGTAIPLLEQAVRGAEAYADAKYDGLKRSFQVGLASAYELADRLDEAQRALDAVIRRWPQDAGARLQLAQLLLASARPREGLRVLRDAASHLDEASAPAAHALTEAVEAFLDAEADPLLFLQANQESYRAYFDEVAAEQEKAGWMAEAMRMTRGPDGEPKAWLAKGARPYALQRADLVHPGEGTVANVYSEKEPMVVAVEGFEPLAEVPVLLPSRTAAFEVWVSSQSPWHWLRITVQLDRPADESALVAAVDPVVGEWYLAGYNGEFGERERGRFHYVGDPEVVGDRAVSYVVDLGRASLDAISALLRRLTVLHDRTPIRRVLFGFGRVPPA
jgi:tetratricopeptide (TPR) repeat protein